ncbi:MAG: hypothetical protein ACXVUE_18580 [Solirubrobacteraceae bacterium]
MNAIETTPSTAELWPRFREPSDLPAIERAPLGERGLAVNTYELRSLARRIGPFSVASVGFD